MRLANIEKTLKEISKRCGVMVDLDEMNRLYGPWKQVPIRFIDYPDINKMMDSFLPMLEELKAAREVIKHAQEFHFVDKYGVYKNGALSAAILDYEEVVNAEG